MSAIQVLSYSFVPGASRSVTQRLRLDLILTHQAVSLHILHCTNSGQHTPQIMLHTTLVDPSDTRLFNSSSDLYKCYNVPL